MSVALLDACVLYPPALRNLLMWLAGGGVYRPRWSDAIHDKWIRNVLADHPDIPPAQLARTRDLMNQIDALALVTDYEPRIAALRLPGPDDRHVLAAAIHTNAAFLVTFNLRDFPAATLAPFGIQALHPDAFLCRQFEAAPEAFLKAAAKHRASLTRPPETADAYLTNLRRSGLTRLTLLLALRRDALKFFVLFFRYNEKTCEIIQEFGGKCRIKNVVQREWSAGRRPLAPAALLCYK